MAGSRWHSLSVARTALSLTGPGRDWQESVTCIHSDTHHVQFHRLVVAVAATVLGVSVAHEHAVLLADVAEAPAEAAAAAAV